MRPPVSVIVPFAGSAEELAAVVRLFAGLRREPGDEVIVVDNGPGHRPAPAAAGVSVLWAGEIASSYHARNAGARAAGGEWLVFCDSDTEPVGALLDAYFDPSPAARTGILAGGVRDHVIGSGLAAQLARETASMSQERTLRNPYMPYAITANLAVRAEAFEEAGGFEPSVRSAGDADLCWRLQRLGWRLEERHAASVLHRNRESMPALWRQRLRHGAGAAWLEERYPGSMPRWGIAALARDSARELLAALAALVRGERDRAAVRAAIPTGWWAFEIGRRLPNRAARR